MNIQPKKKEIETLYFPEYNIKFYHSIKGYKFSSDSLMLFNYIKNIKTNTFIEIGCGDGIISVLYARENKNSKVYALDINQQCINNLKKTLSENNIKNIKTINSNFVMYSQLNKKKFDLVVFNPPYYNYFEGKLSPDLTKLISKHQVLCNETDFLESSFKLLKYNRKFIFIYPEYKIKDKLIDKIKKTGYSEYKIIDIENKRFKIAELKK